MESFGAARTLHMVLAVFISLFNRHVLQERADMDVTNPNDSGHGMLTQARSKWVVVVVKDSASSVAVVGASCSDMGKTALAMMTHPKHNCPKNTGWDALTTLVLRCRHFRPSKLREIRMTRLARTHPTI